MVLVFGNRFNTNPLHCLWHYQYKATPKQWLNKPGFARTNTSVCCKLKLESNKKNKQILCWNALCYKKNILIIFHHLKLIYLCTGKLLIVKIVKIFIFSNISHTLEKYKNWIHIELWKTKARDNIFKIIFKQFPSILFCITSQLKHFFFKFFGYNYYFKNLNNFRTFLIQSIVYFLLNYNLDLLLICYIFRDLCLQQPSPMATSRTAMMG